MKNEITSSNRETLGAWESPVRQDDLERIGRSRSMKDVDAFIEAVNEWIRSRKVRLVGLFDLRIGMIKQPESLPLTIDSLCHWLGIHCNTFRRWCEDEDDPLHDACFVKVRSTAFYTVFP